MWLCWSRGLGGEKLPQSHAFLLSRDGDDSDNDSDNEPSVNRWEVNGDDSRISACFRATVMALATGSEACGLRSCLWGLSSTFFHTTDHSNQRNFESYLA